ncbi:helix-turn-helix domain-containing protein [Prescottella equi]|uniref:helix-turn-helix domain-containing protein n=1 Tax=Rhodococcus hoagii TaxID=43767 RepID=UPI00257518E1|nr:helix-turn-helix domain-containing protein [Prescottella equi]WJJ10356.1 helix-turn-helix domain-containing protein [Prescottella equi]
MSIAAMTWALTAAPVESAQEHVILIALADRASDDGTAAWPSQDWIALRARCSTRTVRRHLRSLEDRGVIRRGDQSLVKHLRADHRPIVWDLNVAGAEPVVDERSRVSARPSRAARPDTADRSGRTRLSDKPSFDSSSEPSTTPSQRAPRRVGVVVNRSAAGRLDGLAVACRDAELPARWDALKREQVDTIAALLDTHGADVLVRAAQKAHQPHNPTRYAQGWIGTWSALPLPRPAAAPRPSCDDCVEGWIEDPVDGRPIRRCACRQVVAA